jgi:MinD-like ATPase involved in chromosome partitioning or flagellar assembly
VVPISVNKGSPVVLSAPRSEVARALEQLALRFLGGTVSQPAGGHGGRRRFLRGG